MPAKISQLPIRTVPLPEDLVVLANEAEARNFKLTLEDLAVAMKPQYAVLLDTVSDTVFYVGEADPGSLTSEAVWRIKKVTSVSGDISVEWADGSSTFSQVWDDRLSLSYS